MFEDGPLRKLMRSNSDLRIIGSGFRTRVSIVESIERSRSLFSIMSLHLHSSSWLTTYGSIRWFRHRLDFEGTMSLPSWSSFPVAIRTTAVESTQALQLRRETTPLWVPDEIFAIAIIWPEEEEFSAGWCLLWSSASPVRCAGYLRMRSHRMGGRMR